MDRLRKRVARVVPFGWVQSEEGTEILEPVQLELDALDRAVDMYKSNRYGLRTLANWVTENSGRYISHVGLKKAMERHNREKYSPKETRESLIPRKATECGEGEQEDRGLEAQGE